jgi:hypothetical protein
VKKCPMLLEDPLIDRIPITVVVMDQVTGPIAVIIPSTTTMITKRRTKIIHITMETHLEHSETMLITNPH